MAELTHEEVVEQRLKAAIQLLIKQGRNYKNLKRDQAVKLRDWGVVYMQSHVVDIEQEAIVPLMDKQEAAIVMICKLVDDLMGTIGNSAEDTDIVPGKVSDDRMINLLKNLRWLTNHKTSQVGMAHVKQFERLRQENQGAKAFEHLMELLRAES